MWASIFMDLVKQWHGKRSGDRGLCRLHCSGEEGMTQNRRESKDVVSIPGRHGEQSERKIENKFHGGVREGFPMSQYPEGLPTYGG